MDQNTRRYNSKEEISKVDNSAGHHSSGFGSLNCRDVRWSEEEIPMALHYCKTALSVIIHTTGELSRMMIEVPSQNIDRIERGLHQIHRASSRLHKVFEGLLLEGMHHSGSVCCIDPDSDLKQKVSFYRGVREAKIRYVAGKTNSVSKPRLIELPVSRLQWEFITDTLLGNAISYCGDQPPDISIGWGLERDQTGQWFHFRVHDRGTGIHKEDLHQIKQPFYRGRNAGYIPGSGTGLYLTAKMLRRCGGKIVIDSEVDRFTEVKISIPLR